MVAAEAARAGDSPVRTAGQRPARFAAGAAACILREASDSGRARHRSATFPVVCGTCSGHVADADSRNRRRGPENRISTGTAARAEAEARAERERQTAAAADAVRQVLPCEDCGQQQAAGLCEA